MLDHKPSSDDVADDRTRPLWPTEGRIVGIGASAGGLEALEQLFDALLVALTGYGAPSDISAARAAGFDEHLIKPAELTKLERILASRKPSVAD